MNPIRKKLQELKELEQFRFRTFADAMDEFRAGGELLAEALPWTPFDPNGHLLCLPLPTPAAMPFELIIVHALQAVRFPQDTEIGFAFSGISQSIRAIHGTMLVVRPGFTEPVTEARSATIHPGDVVAYDYGPGLFLFKQSPRIAVEQDFSFQKI